MSTLSVIIPTFNEEAYLADALKSVDFADEIIVVDSNSKDGTSAIAKAFGARVLFRDFDNFSAQKNFALNYATSEWILFLDADERITHSLKLELLHTLQEGEYDGLKLNFPHFYMNRFLYHHSDTVLRVARRQNARFEGNVHEKLMVEGKLKALNNPVLHYTYKGLEAYIAKKDSYAWFQARQRFAKNEKVSFFKLSIKPAFRFFSSLVLKGGLRDGVPGFAVATVNAYGVFQRYVKLLLLQNGFTEDKQISQVDNVDFELNETYEAYLKNLHKNSHKAGEDLYTKGFKPDFIDFMLKPFGQFWYQFLIKGLIFKGKKGYIKAYLQGFAQAEKFLKVWLMQRHIK
ncbi:MULTISPECIES: glycosyltransferase family 2 protein [unclassified Leeuwenhoekiella]|uniref:glycosyltransferase family 2 protein n=1 Tax=unclassified Leeuwenhoekiella TaxID=2615029 RepID=UPI000C5C4D11|nr:MULTISPECIES: glycosyltransferase family 2 protein [unclassified Leeuwenhoekiella]MAW94888.1 lipopolysaccharide biosynthesis protein [Leeuwenhoekiella sp.]MBA79608.1 lipopolysaccharide biosynthesis protein [Leeuwenhoekiella sp.]|tara:strand:- start:4639 stop:5673 length:1035 start_codon:yes stop_codon:yes gene_type:complete